MSNEKEKEFEIQHTKGWSKLRPEEVELYKNSNATIREMREGKFYSVKKTKPTTTADELIHSIRVNEANLNNIASSGRINGSLLVDLRRILEEYATLRNQQQWISVNDKMPEDFPELIRDYPDLELTVKVLALTETGSVTDNSRLKMAVGEKKWVWNMDYDGEKITYWMPLPSPPQQ